MLKSKLSYCVMTENSLQANLTLVCLLGLFLCQLLSNQLLISLEYPDNNHPLGKYLSHHHGHSEPLAGTMFDNPQAIAESGEVEHEHSDHAHTPYYAIVNFIFAARFYPGAIHRNISACYQACQYSPPNPPPNS